MAHAPPSINFIKKLMFCYKRASLTNIGQWLMQGRFVFNTHSNQPTGRSTFAKVKPIKKTNWITQRRRAKEGNIRSRLAKQKRRVQPTLAILSIPTLLPSVNFLSEKGATAVWLMQHNAFWLRFAFCRCLQAAATTVTESFRNVGKVDRWVDFGHESYSFQLIRIQKKIRSESRSVREAVHNQKVTKLWTLSVPP